MPRLRPLAVRSALLAALLAAAACGGGDAASTAITVDTLPGGIVRTIASAPVDSGHWALVRARDLQPAEEDSAEILKPEDLALADDGSVLVVETSPASVRVYGPDGALQRVIGRTGDGPGEFRTAYIGLRGDTLVAQDPGNSRAQTFDWRTGRLLGARRTACCYWSPIGLDRDGRVYARAIAPPPDTTLRQVQSYVRFALTGDAADTIFAQERQGVPTQRPWEVRRGKQLMMSMLVPLQPRAHFAVDPAGALLTGWSGEYLIRVTRDGRDTVALFGRTGGAAPVAAAEKQAFVDRQVTEMRTAMPNGPSEQELRVAFAMDAIPDVRPAYEAIHPDPAGRRWIRRSTPAGAAVVLDLFDAAGRWLDVVTVPADGWPREAWRPVAFTARQVAVILEGEDGRPFVRTYEIVRK